MAGNDVSELEFLKTKNTKKPALLVFNKHAESVALKHIFELLCCQIEYDSFASEKLLSIRVEFNVKFDGTEPK